MLKYLIFTSALLLFNFSSCSSGHLSKEKNIIQKDTIKQIVMPSMPTMLTTPEQRADFLVRHYWDNVNFADTNYIHHPEITEQAWANYCDLLTRVPLSTTREALHKLIKKAGADKKVLNYMSDLADKYLYDPNSPMRNEEFYIPVLEELIASPKLEDIEKVRPKARLELANKNRIGTKAINFTYTLRSGGKGQLHQLSTDYILIFINNPGCHACSETINALKTSQTINDFLNRKKLTLLSVYPDEEIAEWTRHLIDFPSNWINSYDKELKIRDQQLYDLKAIPTLYLVDKNKIVLLKDATAPIIENYLRAQL